MADLIGHGRCPVCGSKKARYSVSSKKLACIVCNACNFQGFARSDRSDELLRANIPDAAPADMAEVDPVRETPPADPPAPTPTPAPTPPPQPTFSWGLLAGQKK